MRRAPSILSRAQLHEINAAAWAAAREAAELVFEEERVRLIEAALGGATQTSVAPLPLRRSGRRFRTVIGHRRR